MARRLRQRSRPSVLALLTLLSGVIAGCGSGTGASSTPTQTARPTDTAAPPTTAASPSVAPFVAGSIQLTDSDCRFEGAATVPPGAVALTFVNDTARAVAFHVWKLDADRGFEEFAAFVKHHFEEMEQGNDIGAPDFAKIGLQLPVVGGERKTTVIKVTAGTYAIACAVWSETAGRTVVKYAAGPIAVAS